MKYNYQIFNNVTTKEEFLSNIKTAATANGWTCDKDDINANSELYLHSTGNGNQNLYYSMKVIEFLSSDNLVIYANKGFDNSLAYSNQPGKWFYILPTSGYRDYTFELPYPITKQYILCNSSMILIFLDTFSSFLRKSFSSDLRILLHSGLGTINLYSEQSSEGNYLFSSAICYQGGPLWAIYSGLLGTYSNNEPRSRGGLLYANSNRYNYDLGLTILKVNGLYPDEGSLDQNLMYGKAGYRYNYAVQYNDWMSRTALIKPIVSIKHTDAENEYFYPIGELPYYACKVYPYSKAGEIITYGTKKFMTFPLISYTSSDGVAVEINE